MQNHDKFRNVFSINNTNEMIFILNKNQGSAGFSELQKYIVQWSAGLYEDQFSLRNMLNGLGFIICPNTAYNIAAVKDPVRFPLTGYQETLCLPCQQ